MQLFICHISGTYAERAGKLPAVHIKQGPNAFAAETEGDRSIYGAIKHLLHIFT